jgi:hypothetical protein
LTKPNGSCGDFHLVTARVEKNIASAPEKVTLNLGGARFETLKSTLTRIRNTYFTALLASDHFKNANPHFLAFFSFFLNLPFVFRLFSYFCHFSL